MSVVQLLRTLEERAIHISVRDGKLQTRGPKGAITEEIGALIRQHREELCRFLDRPADPSSRTIERQPVRDRFVASAAQRRLWFIDQLEGASGQYNISTALELRGVIDIDALRRALDEIVRRHEALRTTFVETKGAVYQVVDAPRPVPMALVDLSGGDEATQQRVVAERIRQEAERPFDLARDLMLRAQLLTLASDRHVALFTMHHIASDGWSRGILVRELTALYEAFRGGAESPLPPLSIQYGDYSAWQREQLQGEALERDLAY